MSIAMRYNYDDTDPPPWIDSKFFENILRKSENNESIIVNHINIEPATKAGDHFTSIMYRVKVNYCLKLKNTQSLENSQISLIVKIPPLIEDAQSIDMSVFDTEIKMYTGTLVEIQRLMELAGEKQILTPRLV